MSVNDSLPWIAPVLELIRGAVRDDIPVIGHCLGGQLMSRALGGVVSLNPVKEIGWGRVDALPGVETRRWLGDQASFESFHWHGETFTIPAHAVRIAASDYCTNQMFSMGRNLAMQCHVEMTEELIATWCADWDSELQAPAQQAPSVQMPQEMLLEVSEKTARLHRVADGIYGEWVKGLARCHASGISDFRARRWQ